MLDGLAGTALIVGMIVVVFIGVVAVIVKLFKALTPGDTYVTPKKYRQLHQHDELSQEKGKR